METVKSSFKDKASWNN